MAGRQREEEERRAGKGEPKRFGEEGRIGERKVEREEEEGRKNVSVQSRMHQAALASKQSHK